MAELKEEIYSGEGEICVGGGVQIEAYMSRENIRGSTAIKFTSIKGSSKQKKTENRVSSEIRRSSTQTTAEPTNRC